MQNQTHDIAHGEAANAASPVLCDPNDASKFRTTSHGWVDLSRLPLKGRCINWTEAVGKEVRFRYDDAVGVVIIKERIDSQYVRIDIPGYVSDRVIYVGQIVKGQLGTCVGKISSDYKFNVGDVVGHIRILGRYSTQTSSRHKFYHCLCLIDGHTWDLREDHLTRGVGCPVCANLTVLPGVNDIATTAPWMAMLFANEKDAHKYSLHSNQDALFRCPGCGRIMSKLIRQVSSHGFACPFCGDGVSYPNKFVANVLANIAASRPSDVNLSQFVREKTFSWSKNVPVSWAPHGKRMVYDLYVPGYEIIIENQGGQHYSDRDSYGSWFATKDQAENDKAKLQIALSNGILPDHYIQLDCRRSEMQHIKTSILQSALPELLHFTETDIDWVSCHRNVQSSWVVMTWDLYKQGLTIKSIADRLKLHPQTICSYIKRGKGCGALPS